MEMLELPFELGLSIGASQPPEQPMLASTLMHASALNVRFMQPPAASYSA